MTKLHGILKISLLILFGFGITSCIPPAHQTSQTDDKNETMPTMAVSDPSIFILNNVPISAGSSQTCALTSSTEIKCWGSNQYGQLGDGTTTDSATPVSVNKLKKKVSGIFAGGGHTCLITIDNGVQCWGMNDYGQLGSRKWNGMPWQWNSPTPIDVTGLESGVKSVAAGTFFTCALTLKGGVKCWGNNEFGQLGNGTTTNSSIPVDAIGLEGGVTAIAAAGYSVCAVTGNSGVKCWGDNRNGQLGNGKTINSSPYGETIPVDVIGLANDITSVTVGDEHSCAITTSGGVKCWGANGRGGLGNGTTTSQLVPVDVIKLSGKVVAITTGSEFTCALMMNSGVKCWGSNFSGELGNGTNIDSAVPADVPSLLSGVRAISSNTWHTCVLMVDDKVKCWGGNHKGELGDGTTMDRNTPVEVNGVPKSFTPSPTPEAKTIVDENNPESPDTTVPTLQLSTLPLKKAKIISVIAENGCAILDDGETRCWSIHTSYEPFVIKDLPPLVGVDCHSHSSCMGFTKNGDLYEWGIEGPPAHLVKGIKGVTSIASGSSFVCAIASGTPKCWGDVPGRSSLTGKDMVISDEPLFLGTDWKLVDAESSYACFIREQTGMCIGFLPGQTTNRMAYGFHAFDGVKDFRFSSNTYCAIEITGDALCKDKNSTDRDPDPFPKDFFSNVIDFDVDILLSCKIKTNHSVECIKNNIITSIESLKADPVSIKIAGQSTVILLSDGSIAIWGSDPEDKVIYLAGFGSTLTDQKFHTILSSPYAACVGKSKTISSPLAKSEEIIEKGFGTASFSCDKKRGALNSSVLLFGGKNGSILDPPNYKADVSNGIEFDFTPSFTGNLRVTATLTVNSKTGAAAGSAIALIDFQDVISDFLLPEKLGAFLDISKSLVRQTASGVQTNVYAYVDTKTSHNENTTLIGNHGFGSSFPIPPNSQSEEFSSKQVTVSITVPVIKGEKIFIGTGIKTTALAHGWAVAYWNPHKKQEVFVTSVELTDITSQETQNIPTPDLSQIPACPGAKVTRLKPGMQAKVSKIAIQLSLRDAPNANANKIHVIASGRKMSILSEPPICANGAYWWHVYVDQLGFGGWAREGDNEDYWIDPIP